MKRWIVIIEGIAGYLDLRADSRDAARCYARDHYGLRQLPARHCVIAVAP